MNAEAYNYSQVGRLWTVSELPEQLAQVAQDHGVDSSEFAVAVGKIQAGRGLDPDGKLGPRTWETILSEHRSAEGNEVLTSVGSVQFKRPTRDQAPPVNKAVVNGGNKRVASLWNNYGGAIAELAEENGIPVGVALAVFLTEAGSKAYNHDTGLIIIRFEQHLFNRQLGLSRARMRHDGKQLTEWNGLQVAAAKNLEKAFRCTSFGLPQIMGFNCYSVGYESAVEMALAFQDDVATQVRGFFDFCKKGGLDELIRRKDWQGFTRRYNGPGQVSHYSRVLENHLVIVGKMGFNVL